jgi:hypothetical protein
MHHRGIMQVIARYGSRDEPDGTAQAEVETWVVLEYCGRGDLEVVNQSCVHISCACAVCVAEQAEVGTFPQTACCDPFIHSTSPRPSTILLTAERAGGGVVRSAPACRGAPEYAKCASGVVSSGADCSSHGALARTQHHSQRSVADECAAGRAIA